jgi:ATP adenylyltransferase
MYGTEKEKRSEFIIKRGNYCFIILNKYPYNAGHLMIAPIRHIGNISQLESGEWEELYKQLLSSKKALDSLLKPDGYNIGMNLGRPAGAGLDSHIHLHIVPRWVGDTNFISTLSQTRIISQALRELSKKLSAIIK